MSICEPLALDLYTALNGCESGVHVCMLCVSLCLVCVGVYAIHERASRARVCVCVVCMR